MLNTLNLSAVERYSKEYAAKICEEYFRQNDSILGKQILSITKIPQVNMLTIRALYDKWNTETQRLKSPYFNYEEPAVQEALKVFMNTVSQYISVKREHFEPLLANATAETLTLLLEPQTFYKGVMRDLPNFKLTKESIAPLTKYIQINKVVLPRLVERLADKESVFVNEATAWIDDIIGKIELEKPEKYLPIFEEVLPLPTNLLPTNSVAELPKEEKNMHSFFDQNFEIEPVAEPKPKPAVAVETPLPVVMKVEEPVVIETIYQPEVVKPTESVIETSSILERIEKAQSIFEKRVEKVAERVQNKDNEELRLNEKLAGEKNSLNDTANRSHSILDHHQVAKIDGFAKAISVNQKYLFTNNLFGGNLQAFMHALDEIELCKDFSEAKELILKKYVPRYLWDITSAEAEEFIDIVKRRFH